jgi:hypothetical protein
LSTNKGDYAKNDRFLDELIKKSRDENKKQIERPSDESIRAYLLGAATKSQEEEVRSALILSAGFRREILDMAEDLASLTDPKMIEEFNKIPVPTPPGLERFLARGGAETEKGQSVFSRIKGFFSPRNLLLPFRVRPAYSGGRLIAQLSGAGAIVAVVVLLTYIGIVQLNNDGYQMAAWSPSGEMDAGLFVSNIVRTPNGSSVESGFYESHEKAAQAGFMRQIRYENGEYIFDSLITGTQAVEPYRRILLRFVDASGETLHEFSAAIPMTKHEQGGLLQAWSLAIPSRDLHRLEMTSDTMSVVWSAEMGLQGCLIFTYEKDGQYSATSGEWFDF